VCAFLPLPPFAHAAAGASGARHSLRPLSAEGGTFPTKLARTRGEIEKACSKRLKNVGNNAFNKPCSPKMPSSKSIARKLNDPRVARESLS
jgi:hypothetical protein